MIAEVKLDMKNVVSVVVMQDITVDLKIWMQSL